MLSKLSFHLVEFLWPGCCVLCGIPGTQLCQSCERSLPRWPPDERFWFYGDEELLIYSPFRYEEPLRSAIVKGKYAFESYRFSALARLLCQKLPADRALAHPDAVIPIPLSRQRTKERGYNQASIIAGEVGRHLRLPLLRGRLRRMHSAPPQASLELRDRLVSPRGSFSADGVMGRSILLVDDVVTSGGTLLAAAEALFSAGARQVSAVTLARTAPPQAGGVGVIRAPEEAGIRSAEADP